MRVFPANPAAFPALKVRCSIPAGAPGRDRTYDLSWWKQYGLVTPISVIWMKRAVLPTWKSLVTSALLLALALAPSPAVAAPRIAGSKCTKVGTTRVVSGVSYKCVKSGQKLIWQATSSKAKSPTTTTAQPKKKFVIETLPLDLASDVWQWPTDVKSWPARDFPPIHIFGKAYQGKIEATLMFDMLKVGTPVLSPVSGIVIEVRNQPESCDVELYISDGVNTPLSLDHITTSKSFKQGDPVKAGEVVGSVPKWQCTDSFGRFELMVISGAPDNVAVCPVNYFSDRLLAAWRPTLAKVMNDWNAYVGNRGGTTYSPAEIATGACATPTAPG